MGEEIKLYVIYIGVAGVRSEDIEDYVQKITSKIIPASIEGEIIIIPTHSYETRIECINPKYITNEELVSKHTELMKELHKELHHQMEQYRNEEN